MNEAQIRTLRVMIQNIKYKLNDLESKIQSYEVEEWMM